MNERKRRDVVPLASTVYVTGVEPGSSRATVALGVAELLSRRVRRLGAFRPLVRTDPDPMLPRRGRQWNVR